MKSLQRVLALACIAVLVAAALTPMTMFIVVPLIELPLFDPAPTATASVLREHAPLLAPSLAILPPSALPRASLAS